MASYTNTHTNHTDDASKKWPVNIPWSSNWDTAKYPVTEKNNTTENFSSHNDSIIRIRVK